MKSTQLELLLGGKASLGGLFLNGIEGLDRIQLPDLQSIGDLKIVKCNNVESLVLPALEEINASVHHTVT